MPKNDLRLAKEDSIRNAYVATMLTEERAKTALASFQQEGIADTEQFVKMLVASRGNYQTLLDFRKSAAECDREGLAFCPYYNNFLQRTGGMSLWKYWKTI